MANAIKAAESILGMEISGSMARAAREEEIYAKKGILAEPGQKEADRMPKLLYRMRKLRGCLSKPGKYIHSRAGYGQKAGHPCRLYV